MTTPDSDFLDILRALTEHHVDFIVVGGVCAVLNGAPIDTFDLDIVHARQPENLERLVKAIQVLSAHYRDLAGRYIVPTASHLASDGHHLLLSRAGPFDLLGTIGQNLGYEELLPHTLMVTVGPSVDIRLLELDKLIEVKEQAGRDKDKAVLPILRRTLEAKRKS